MADVPKKSAPRKKPTDVIPPKLRKRYAPMKPLKDGAGVTVEDYNKLVEDRNELAGVLEALAIHGFKFHPPMHLPRPDRAVLRRLFGGPLGMKFEV